MNNCTHTVVLRFAFVLVAGLLIACNPYYYKTMNPDANYPPTNPSSVRILMGKEVPSCEPEMIGRLEMFHGDSNNQKMFAGLKAEIAAVGGDGVMHLTEGGIGTVGQNRWAGDIYHCKSK